MSKLKVYRFNQWGREEVVFHMVRNKKWGKGAYKLLQLSLNLFCKKDVNLYVRDIYEDYDREKHVKKLCKECVAEYKRLIHEQRIAKKQQATQSPSPSQSSETSGQTHTSLSERPL